MCNICSDPTCLGENQLREFKDWADLSDHLGEPEIVQFVNSLAKIRASQKKAARRMHAKERLLLELLNDKVS